MKKNRIMSLILAFFMLFLCAFAGTAMAEESETPTSGDVGNVHWELNDGVLTFSVPDGEEGEIPDYWEYWGNEYGDRFVPEWTALADEITGVVVGDGITSVGAFSLRDLYNAGSVQLPGSLRRIGYQALGECNTLETLTIPASVDQLDECFAWSCESLTKIVVEDGNEWYESLDGVVFNEACSELIAYPIGRTGSTYVVPDSVRRISSAAFENEEDLIEITLPEGVMYIGNSAFCNTRLTDVVLPKTVAEIDDWAFSYNPALTSVTFEGAYPDRLGSNAFIAFNDEEAPKPESFRVIANVNMPGWDGFDGELVNGETEKYTLELTDESIGEVYASGEFDNGMAWRIGLDGTLTVSGEGEMPWFDWEGAGEAPWKKYTGYITAIEIEEGIIDIGGRAFAHLYKAKSLSLPDSLEWINDGGFYACESLESVEIPGGVQYIEGNAFDRCYSVKEYVISEENENFKTVDGVLYNGDMSWLMAYPAGSERSEFTVPGEVYEINNGAFRRANHLETVVLSNGVGVISDEAFAECENLASVTLGATVGEIRNAAFASCPELKTAVFTGPEPAELGGDLFTDANEEFKVRYPAGAGWNVEDGIWRTAHGQEYAAEADPGETSVVDSGEFENSEGQTFTWSVTNAGLLTVNGEGELPQFHEDEGGFGGQAPWYPYRGLVREIVVGEGITALGHRSFADASYAHTVSLPSTLEKLYDSAFAGLGIRELNLPASVAVIENGAFDSFPKLERISLGEGAESYTIVDGVLYTADMTELVLYPAAKEGSTFEMPDDVVMVHPGAFKHAQLETITLSENLEYIGWWAFSHNYIIREIEIPMSVTYIASGAFRAMVSLEKATFCGTEPVVEDWIFGEAAENFTVHYPNNLPGWNVNDGEWTPDDNPAYHAVGYEADIPEGPRDGGEFIDEEQYDEEGNLIEGDRKVYWSLDWDGTLTFWGYGPMPDWDWDRESPWLKYANSITKVIFADGNGITKIGRHTFRDCVNLTSIELPANVERIESEAFRGCRSLTDITLNEGLREIWHAAFEETCPATLTLPASLEWVDHGAFKFSYTGAFAVAEGNEWFFTDEAGALYRYEDEEQTCFSLVAYPIGREIEEDANEYLVKLDTAEIYGHAFSGSTLSFIGIPDSVRHICSWAFEWCRQLELVYIPIGIRTISDNTFHGCESLQEIYFRCAPPEEIWHGAFENMDTDSVTVYYPDQISAWTDVLNEDRTWTCTTPEGENGEIESHTFRAESYDAGLPETMAGSSVEVEEWDEEGNRIGSHEIHWSIDWNGKLSFSGAGSMPDWDWEDFSPWYEYADSVKSVEFGNELTKIGRHTLRDNNFITSVTIPGNIELIEFEAIVYCGKLNEIIIEDGVKAIRECAVDCPDALIEVLRIPATADDITPNAFGMTRIGKFLIEGESEYFTDEAGVLYYWFDDEHTCYGLHSYPIANGADSYTVPDKTIVIDDMAFKGAHNLTSVEIADSVEHISRWAFAECTGLTEITLSADLRGLSHYIFNGCKNLEKVYFRSDPPEYVEDSNFSECSENLVLYYPENNEAWQETVIREDDGEYWELNFQVCDDEGNEVEGEFFTERYAVQPYSPANITEGECIDEEHNIRWYIDYAGTLHIEGNTSTPDWDWENRAPWYGYRDSVNRIVIHDGITRIGSMNFVHMNCEAEFADSVLELGDNAFTECDLFGTVRIPRDMHTMERAFTNTRVHWYEVAPENPGFFADESGALIERNFVWTEFYDGQPEGSEIIEIGGREAYVFNDTWLLVAYPSGSEADSYTFDSRIIYVFENAFCGAEYLNEINLNSGLLYIEQHAFTGCSNVREMTIPETVREVGRNFISGWETLEKVTFLGCAPAFYDPTVFEGCSDSLVIAYPAGYAAWDNIITHTEDGDRWDITYINWDSENQEEYVVSYCAEAFDAPTGGVFSDDLFWNIDEYGILNITGSGRVPNYDDSFFAPWAPHSGGITGISVIPADGCEISIGSFAFHNLGEVDFIDLGEGVNSIGSYAFAGCELPADYCLTVPGSATIEWSAFACVNIESYEIIGSEEGAPNGHGYFTEENGTMLYYADEFDMVLLDAGQSVTEVWLPDGLTVIASGAFDRCFHLTTLMIPASIRYIGGAVFDACQNLDVVYFMGAMNENFTVEAESLFGEALMEDADRMVIVRFPKYAYDTWSDFIDHQDAHEFWTGKFIHGGDVNGDLCTNTDDVQMLLDYYSGRVSGEEILFQGMDVNGDYEYTRADLMLLQRWLAGWDVLFNRIIGADD